MKERTLVGNLELGEVPRLWRKLEFLHQRAMEVSEQSPVELTRRRVDESRPGGHRLYSAVERSLGAARDCDLALQSLLQNHGATQTAMWALLRTQFESAFWALWLLDPENSQERVLRGIGSEWRDDRASMRYLRDFADDSSFPFVDEDRLRVREQAADDHATAYRAEAAANGASWVKPPEIDMTQAITKLSPVLEGPGWGSMFRGVWRSLAALQHGSAGALLRVSDRSSVGPAPGGEALFLSPSDEAFQQLAEPTLSLHVSALARLIECCQPYQVGVIDLSDLHRRRAFWKAL